MSRTTFLARMRAAVETANGTTVSRRQAAVAERLARPPAHPLPACAKIPAEDRENELIAALEARGADVIVVPELTALPRALENQLQQQTTQLLIGDDPRLADLPWNSPPQPWNPEQKPEDGTAALTHAFAAVAETGTLVLASSAASPATLAFLPETHLVAVARETVVGSFEAAFSRLRTAFPDRLPRAVNLVSGPSRTSDIEGRLVKGAHGPRRLVVILYGAPAETAPAGLPPNAAT